MLFDFQTRDEIAEAYSLERKQVSGFSQLLNTVPAKKLLSKTEELAEQFNVKLTLVLKHSLVLSPELVLMVSSEDGLLLGSHSGVQLIKNIENHPEWLINYWVDNKADIPGSSFSLELGMTALFYSGVCIVLLVWAFPLARRLSKLNRLASEFGSGDLSHRASTGKFSYIGELEISFNRMAGQIEALLNENKLLADSLSHDLRTPLSCFRFGVDAALETDSTNKKNYYLERMDEDLTRMENMLNAFLDYACVERKRFELSTVNTDIVELISFSVETCMPLADKREVQLSIVSNEPFKMIQVDPDWMGRALVNLISNAIYHGKSCVIVTCEVIAHSVILSVEDDGAGVPDNEIENIFKAFVKLDKSRSKRNRFGLGLTIVNRVISWHQGEVKVSASSQLGGAKFSVILQS